MIAGWNDQIPELLGENLQVPLPHTPSGKPKMYESWQAALTDQLKGFSFERNTSCEKVGKAFRTRAKNPNRAEDFANQYPEESRNLMGALLAAAILASEPEATKRYYELCNAFEDRFDKMVYNLDPWDTPAKPELRPGRVGKVPPPKAQKTPPPATLTAKTEPRTLTDADREAIYRVIDTTRPRGVRNMALIRCLDVTGMRVSELCNLDVCDYEVVDRASARLHFHVPEKAGSKTGRREVYIEEATAPGTMLLMQAMDAWLKIRREWQPGTEALFCSQPTCGTWSPKLKQKIDTHGERLVRRQIGLSITRYAQRSGVSKAHPHMYRHTRVEKMLMDGIPVNVIAGLMGHTVKTLTSEYAHACRAADVKQRMWRDDSVKELLAELTAKLS